MVLNQISRDVPLAVWSEFTGCKCFLRMSWGWSVSVKGWVCLTGVVGRASSKNNHSVWPPVFFLECRACFLTLLSGWVEDLRPKKRTQAVMWGPGVLVLVLPPRLAVCSRESHLPSLSLGFPFCRMRRLGWMALRTSPRALGCSDAPVLETPLKEREEGREERQC